MFGRPGGLKTRRTQGLESFGLVVVRLGRRGKFIVGGVHCGPAFEAEVRACEESGEGFCQREVQLDVVREESREGRKEFVEECIV